MLDVAAFSQLASDKGLKDAQYHLRVYRKVLTDKYDALPVSMQAATRTDYLNKLDDGAKKEYEAALKEAVAAKVPEYVAVAKAVRAAKVVRKQVKQDKPGAPKGQPMEQPTSHNETLEQVVTRYGMFEILDAVTRLLAAEKNTADKAKSLASLTRQLAVLMKPAEQKAA
jgi:hypothetical protein